MNYKLFQVCFEPNQFSEVESPFVAFDNVENKKPELREMYIFNRIIDEGFADDVDAWGVFSSRWNQKLRYPAVEITNAIDANPGNDVYIFNHARIQTALTYNVWEQGEFYHKGIVQVSKKVLEQAGYDSSVLDQVMTDVTCYCSYFVATKEFWKEYIEFLKSIKDKLDELTGEDAELYYSNANYARDPNLTLFPFIIERMFSTFMLIKKPKFYSHAYNYEWYKSQIGDLTEQMRSLYELKKQDIQGWNGARQFYLKNYPQILNCD
jgi:hypothetical protein